MRTYNKVKSFVIDRAKWLNGRVNELSSQQDGREVNGTLLDPASGLQCCLGLYASACGIPKQVLKNKGLPSELPGKYQIGSAWINLGIHELSDENDVSDPEESIIKTYFAEAGVKVTFKGRTADAVKKLARTK